MPEFSQHGASRRASADIDTRERESQERDLGAGGGGTGQHGSCPSSEIRSSQRSGVLLTSTGEVLLLFLLLLTKNKPSLRLVDRK